MELYAQHLQAHLQAVEEALPKYLPASGGLQAVVEEAMGYACAAGGKRLRPVLLLEFCRICGGHFFVIGFRGCARFQNMVRWNP